MIWISTPKAARSPRARSSRIAYQATSSAQAHRKLRTRSGTAAMRGANDSANSVAMKATGSARGRTGRIASGSLTVLMGER
jgi:hypothetical protein